MKAVCVNPDRELEVRDVPAIGAPPPDHVRIEMDACAINHGDHTFLKMRSLLDAPANQPNVWGSSGAGRIVAIGAGVPQSYIGKKVAIYRSLSMIHSRLTVGLWSEQAQVHYLSCLILPDHVDVKDYSGSLVNIITAYAFLSQVRDDGHHGIIATAGNSATGRMLIELARRERLPVVAIVRSAAAKQELELLGAKHVLDATEADFENQLTAVAEQLETTAVFDGVGGALVTRILPRLPMKSTLYSYGYMAGPEPASFPTTLLMTRNLTLKAFSNFASETVQNPQRLSAALTNLSEIVDHPAFKTRIGETFKLDQIDAAMKGSGEAKSILVP